MSSAQATFKYKAETLEGQQVEGRIDAASAGAARNQLAIQGLRVIDLREKKSFTQIEISPERVPAIEVMHFSRQMATFVRAGIPVTDALENLRQGVKNKRFQGIIAEVIEEVTSGRPLATAMQKHSSVFPPYYVSLLEAAEYTGRLDDAFDRLHKYMKRDLDLVRSVRKALIYPCILLTLAFGVCLLIIYVAIPKFAEFFESFDAELPLPTRILMGIADFVEVYGLFLIVALVGAGAAFTLVLRTHKGRKALHRFQLRVPLVSTIVGYAATERFSRVLSSMLESGVALPEALGASEDSASNLVIKEKLREANEQVLLGRGISDPLGDAEIFPPTVIQMIRVGERTGSLAEQLESSATYCEEELGYSVEKLTQWFEPIVILIIGLVVGFVALSMVSAMYGIYGQVQV